MDDVATLRRAVTRLARRLRAERPSDSLSTAKLLVLGHLYTHGPSTPGQVAAAEHEQPQSLTRVFAELEREGLLTRTPSTRDRRVSIIAITPSGVEALERDMAERDAWLVSAIERLSQTEIELLQIAARIIDRLADLEPASGTRLSLPDSTGGPRRHSRRFRSPAPLQRKDARNPR